MKKIFPTIIAASLLILILFLTRTPHPALPPGAPASLPALETRINAQIEAPPALHSPLSTLHSPRSLSKTLTPDELKPLYTFLSVKHNEDDRQLGHALKSDVMDALCTQTTLPIDLTKLLIQVYHDPTQNPVIRDYALQHLATLHENLGAPPSRRPPWATPNSLSPGQPPKSNPNVPASPPFLTKPSPKPIPASPAPPCFPFITSPALAPIPAPTSPTPP